MPVAAPQKPAAEASAPTSTAAPALPPLATADQLAASLGTVPTADKQSAQAGLLPFLGEPGKEIRRIVIFYRNGSFADYKPES
ncbi:hypothetical protein [Hymenobacter sp. H14-R3]|uniref:hypothetical protein n=1 Tax=Hymenobacter sp. H14-R3 TaxID=3046308 RepID=UPI0024BB3439|nr:hypothetical protein [Hymenobacter sp. H14-R3]